MAFILVLTVDIHWTNNQPFRRVMVLLEVCCPLLSRWLYDFSLLVDDIEE